MKLISKLRNLFPVLALALLLAQGVDCTLAQAYGGRECYEAPIQAPAEAPERYKRIIGKYENGANNFLILEDGGALKMFAGGKYYELKEKSNIDFELYANNVFQKTNIHFTVDESGSAIRCIMGPRVFKRKLYGTEGGRTFKIKPLKPVDELRKIAGVSMPPAENEKMMKPSLVNVLKTGAVYKLDIRYATPNNFMGAAFYSKPEAYLQGSAAIALARAAAALEKIGYGIVIYDAYRPWYVTRMFYDATPDEMKDFVADPAKGSKHNRGTAVDVGLFNPVTGGILEMVSGYDEFSERAVPSFAGGTSLQRHRREILRRYMENEGFKVYDCEWWHFDYMPDAVKYPIMNMTFEELGAANVK